MKTKPTHPKGRRECVEEECNLLLQCGGCAKMKRPEEVKDIKECPIGNWKEK